MIEDDDSYQLDSDGVRVLIGLTSEESAEFRRLDSSVGHLRPPESPPEQWTHADDRRWFELYRKHEEARRPFLPAGKTRH